jgi:hypothetical protein
MNVVRFAVLVILVAPAGSAAAVYDYHPAVGGCCSGNSVFWGLDRDQWQ